ncbi:HAMP domain-containing sensor histidine kinase [Sulfurimonas sp.]|uniref:sensor histidine kinase n=1 Tax=Sulfurimonas sp. TaxID=2022749 RepID=UPI002AAFEC66|nr:HAMP domain-containing sensor histidine kinase [Sulfurimonas sp.]
MQENISKELIDEIVKLSKNADKELYSKIKTLINIYNEQVNLNNKITKENDFFLKKWDKRNILSHNKKDKLMEQQSRLASMGEMIDAVAHQWKQPLNAISMMVDILRDDYSTGHVNDSYIDDLDTTVHLQIDHMVNTLSEFRTFLRPSTKNEDFQIGSVIQNVEILMKDELITQNLHIKIDIDEDISIFGNKNEFKHLFINLINNSIDAFNEKNISAREINIRAYKEGKNIYIEVEDNAGGIPKNIINHIFRPNVTTKAEGKGTGIGLYMSSQIVTKNNGTINVHNTDEGAFFTIILHQPFI